MNCLNEQALTQAIFFENDFSSPHTSKNHSHKLNEDIFNNGKYQI